MIPEDVMQLAQNARAAVNDCPHNEMQDKIIARAILTDREARSGIPAGYKLVPVEPTEEMEKAALKKVRPYHDISDQDWRYKMPKDLFRLAWTAMLAASPSPSREETETRGTSALLLEAEKALEEAEETLGLVEHKAFPDPAHHETVKALGRRIGFGALMSTAEAGWREVLQESGVPSGGEFVSGPCRVTVDTCLAKIRSTLSKIRGEG